MKSKAMTWFGRLSDVKAEIANQVNLYKKLRPIVELEPV